MSGRILIIDSVATNRIVLKVKLLAAQYRVSACATLTEAETILAQDPPDLLLLDLTTTGPGILGFCAAIRSDPRNSDLPIIGMGHFDAPLDRLPALAAGVDDVMEKPISDTLLLARIRSLMRAAGAVQELRLREDTSRALGFAEPAVGFKRPSRIVLATDAVATSLAFRGQLAAATGAQLTALDPAMVLSEDPNSDPADLYVIDARKLNEPGENERVFGLIANLRSRSESRHVPQIVLVPRKGEAMAAMALDLGANDAVPAPAGIEEVALRCKALISRKGLIDRLRATVENGLQAAVTDPLTGLFNRRYAMPHLAAMSEKAAETGRDFALLVIDIDHFKRVNDSFGHAVGDRVLMQLAQMLRNHCRAEDLISRIGGEEFMVALPDTTAAQAQVTAERLREQIAATPIRVPMTSEIIRITLSIGVAICGQGSEREDVQALLERADVALYAAKSAGRNLVQISARPRAA